MLKAVIFDFDGVIADSELCHFTAFNEVFASFGLKLTKEQYYADYLGYTDDELLEKIKIKFGIDFDGKSIEKIAEEKAVIFERIITQSDRLIDGIPEFIKKLSDSSIPLAINSGAIAADIKVMLAGTGLEKNFKTIVSADDVSKGKPDPQGYLLAADRLSNILGQNIKPNQCIAIEDSVWGIISAKNAGMKVVAVTNSYPAEKLQDADLIADSVRELTVETLQKLCS